MTTENEPKWLRDAHARGEYGERVKLARAGRAVRLAMDRAETAEPRLSPLEWRVFNRVIRHTETYTKVVDEVAFNQLVPAGAHPKAVSRALRRLADRGIFHYQAGRGRPSSTSNKWRPTVIGLPDPDDEKVTATGSLSGGAKGNEMDDEKVTATRARTRARSFQAPEKNPTEETAACSAPASEDDDLDTALRGIRLRGSGRQTVLDAYRENPVRVHGLIGDVLARSGVRNPGGLLVRLVEDGDEPKPHRGLIGRALTDMDFDDLIGALRQPMPDRPRGPNSAGLSERARLYEELERRQEQEDVCGKVVAAEWVEDVVHDEPVADDPEPTTIATPKPGPCTADAVARADVAIVAEAQWLQASIVRMRDAAQRRAECERETREFGARDAA